MSNNTCNKKITFDDIQKLFKSWGLYPIDEMTDDYNPDVIDRGINRPCYNKFLNDAHKLLGPEKANFVRTQIEALDDSYYVGASTWAGLEANYKKFLTQ
jgi:hypothetical protein